MIITIQEAINVIRCEMCISYEGMTDDFYEALNIVIDALTAQEKAQEVSNDSPELDSEFGERKTGRWIHQAKFGRIECDQCGKVYRNAFVPKNYCPNCGARMEGNDK